MTNRPEIFHNYSAAKPQLLRIPPSTIQIHFAAAYSDKNRPIHPIALHCGDTHYRRLMYFRTTTLLSRSCRYFLQSPVPLSQKATFSISARSLIAVNAAMADTAASAVTPELLKGKLVEQLQAQHVEIEDLSGASLFAFFNFFFPSKGYWITML